MIQKLLLGIKWRQLGQKISKDVFFEKIVYNDKEISFLKINFEIYV